MKPTVFNYQEHERVVEENKKLKAEVANLLIRCRIAEADRPTGEWVDDCTCSICHWMHEDNNGFALITKYNYCPNCGAVMKGGEDE